MTYGISENIADKILSVFRHFPEIDEAILFGSQAKGNYKEGSDIDITLKGDKLDLALLARISSQLDDLSIPYTIDLSIYNQIHNKELQEHIQRVGKNLLME